MAITKELPEDKIPGRNYIEGAISLLERATTRGVNAPDLTGKRQSPAVLADAATYSLARKDLDFRKEDIISQQEMLEAFAANPTVLYTEKSWLWEQNIRALIDQHTADSGTVSPSFGDYDEALLMCENRSEKGIGITTLSLLHGAGDDMDVHPLHIIASSKLRRAMIVGETMPAALVERLRDAGICYVSRRDSAPEAQAKAAVEAVVGEPDDSSTYERLGDAFRYRNGRDEQSNALPVLHEMLANPAIETLYDKYVVRSFIAPTELEKYRLLSAAGNAEDTTALEAILAARPDAVNWRVSDMQVTPLMIAARDGNLEGMKILIAAGADINAQDGHGKTAVGWAMRDEQNYEAAKLLRQQGARLDIPDAWSKTAEKEYKDATQIKVQKPLRLKTPKGPSV